MLGSDGGTAFALLGKVESVTVAGDAGLDWVRGFDPVPGVRGCSGVCRGSL